jgi:predicted HTH transcriptional regulator
MFKSGRKTGDYHHEMNSGNFEKWIQEKLIPKLPPITVIVIDNASYHNIEVNRAPTSNTKVGGWQNGTFRIRLRH